MQRTIIPYMTLLSEQEGGAKQIKLNWNGTSDVLFLLSSHEVSGTAVAWQRVSQLAIWNFEIMITDSTHLSSWNLSPTTTNFQWVNRKVRTVALRIHFISQIFHRVLPNSKCKCSEAVGHRNLWQSALVQLAYVRWATGSLFPPLINMFERI